MENNPKLERYATVYNQIKALTVELEGMKEGLMGDLKALGKTKLPTEHGTFTLGNRPSYDYSSVLKKKMDKVKIEQMREIDKGVATKVDNFYLMFKGPKENEPI